MEQESKPHPNAANFQPHLKRKYLSLPIWRIAWRIVVSELLLARSTRIVCSAPPLSRPSTPQMPNPSSRSRVSRNGT